MPTPTSDPSSLLIIKGAKHNTKRRVEEQQVSWTPVICAPCGVNITRSWCHFQMSLPVFPMISTVSLVRFGSQEEADAV